MAKQPITPIVSENTPKFYIRVKSRCIIVIREDNGDQFPIVVTGKEASEMLSFISQLNFNKDEVQKT